MKFLVKERLLKTMGEKGISQRSLAKHMNLSSAAVSDQFNKNSDIDSLRYIIAVANLTGVSPSELAFDDNIQVSEGKVEASYPIIETFINSGPEFRKSLLVTCFDLLNTDQQLSLVQAILPKIDHYFSKAKSRE